MDEAQDAAVFLGGISELQEHDVVSAGDSVEFFKVHSEDVVQSLKLIHADINNIDNFALALNSVRGSLLYKSIGWSQFNRINNKDIFFFSQKNSKKLIKFKFFVTWFEALK